MKFCSHCGAEVMDEAVICVKCGCSVGANPAPAAAAQPSIIINNANTNTNTNMNANGFGMGRPRNKWVAFLLCLFLGFVGAHKFYEGKGGMGILYIFTGGLFGIGWFIDLVNLLLKPNPYYIYR